MKKKFNEVKFQNITIKKFIKKNINDRYINWLNDPEVVKYSSQKINPFVKIRKNIITIRMRAIKKTVSCY